METNNLDEQDIFTNPDVADDTADTPEEYDQDQPEVDVDGLQAKLQKLQEDYTNQKIRAEKAEAKLKSGEPAKRGETSKGADLSAFDLIAVAKANLSEEALREAMDFAKYKKISVAEAIKMPAVKAIIANIEEAQKTAEATNTGYARRGSAKLSDDALLDNARKGQLPESDADIRRLVQLRRANK